MTESAIFNAVVKLPPEERAAYLDRACGSQAELRLEVESLLRAHNAADNLLTDPLGRSRATADYEPITEGPGTVIGPYKLMEEIGQGGMGLVFVAEQQQPVRRKVALKIIKPGMDTRDVIARFEAERQALALMDHPNIAKVLDAGATDSGRPYFVMELVKGIPIIDYCDLQQLTAAERLNLFLSVCQAVQHAHGKGVIHRDLKPSNILVAPHDGVPVVKVIDFGVAKAIGQQLTDKTIYTRFTQMIGTPLYMSPEQAEFNALDVDIRSDIYSLGVLLYELLTGTTPFDRTRFATAAYDEIRRIIKEEEPPKPSTRLSTMGESLSKVSSQRKTEPAKLSALVKGDLDWIVMKALEKDRSRRYETASAFAADVRRFLAEEPIEARPPSTWYRFRKLARRNKVALSTAALVAAALLLGTGVSTWQAVRARRAETAALINERMAQAQKREVDFEKDKADKRGEELATLNEKLRRSNYIADVNLARHAWDENNVALALELLDRHRPKPGETDQRGFEWHYLRRLPHRDLATVKAHAGGATTVAWTPDGKRLFSLGTTQNSSSLPGPGEIKLWDVATLTSLTRNRVSQSREGEPPGEPLSHRARQEPRPPGITQGHLGLKGATDTVFQGDLSPDGKLLAAGCHDKTVRVWDLETCELVATLEGHTDTVSQVVFSPDCKHLASRTLNWASATGSFEIKIWDLETHKAIVSSDEQRGVGSLALAFSPDGKQLAAGVGANALKIWDSASGRELLVKHLQRSSVVSLAFSPDGERVAVAGMPREVQILDAHTADALTTYSGDIGIRGRLTFSPMGDRLASAGSGGIELWDTESGQLIRTFKGHVGRVTDIAFSPDGTFLASAGLDGCVKVWDAKSDPESIPLSGPLARLFVVLSPGGRTALTCLGESTIQLWNTTTGKPLFEPLKLEHNQVSFDFTADGNRLALTDQGKNVTIWDVATGKIVHTFKHDGPPHGRAALSPDGKWFACSGPEGGLQVWDVQKGTPFRTFRVPKNPSRWLFSPDRRAWRRAISAGLSRSGTSPLAEIFAPPSSRTARSRGYASAPTASGWAPYALVARSVFLARKAAVKCRRRSAAY